MLQPIQLKEVFARHASEIAELRRFLAQAGIPVETAEALHIVAARLPGDRAFHRDLTSYVWVAISSGNHQISYPDLLGVLALAAAGPNFAASADEDDAHDLLRFLMEARGSLDAASGARPRASVPPDVSRAPVPVTQAGAQPVTQAAAPSAVVPSPPAPEKAPAPTLVTRSEPLAAAPQPVVPPVPRVEERKPEPIPPFAPRHFEIPITRLQKETSKDRKPLLWIAIAACVLLTVVVGLWSRRSATPSPRVASNATVQPASPSVAPSAAPDFPSVAEPAVPTPRSADTAIARPREALVPPPATSRIPVIRRDPRLVPSPPSGPVWRASPAANLPAPARSPSITQQKSTAPITSTVATPQIPSSVIARAAVPNNVRAVPSVPIKQRPANPPPNAVSASTLNKLLGAPTESPYAPGELDAQGRRHPRLLRRPGASSAQLPDGDQVADLRQPNLPGSPAARASAAPKGIVRAGSEGLMAGNVIYSPAPAYPAEASAAHVQGEVRVKATIDRDGNVASARVISGAPLLRDAALDAVQRWRFHPNIAGGKPTTSSVIAIVDFQLP